jgi:hypothetical protein
MPTKSVHVGDWRWVKGGVPRHTEVEHVVRPPGPTERDSHLIGVMRTRPCVGAEADETLWPPDLAHGRQSTTCRECCAAQTELQSCAAPCHANACLPLCLAIARFYTCSPPPVPSTARVSRRASRGASPDQGSDGRECSLYCSAGASGQHERETVCAYRRRRVSRDTAGISPTQSAGCSRR